MSGKIIKIERELFKNGITCEFRFVEEHEALEYYVCMFKKDFTKIEIKLSKWNIMENTNNLIHVISMFFEHSEIVFKPNKV